MGHPLLERGLGGIARLLIHATHERAWSWKFVAGAIET